MPYSCRTCRLAATTGVLFCAVLFTCHEQGLLADDQTVPTVLSAQASDWLDELVGANYRMRREAFLHLCDRQIPIDNWLAQETKSKDQYRASVASWLIRLRKSNGTPAQRVMLLADLESLRNSDSTVIDRYVGEGRWETLIELLTLLEPGIRNSILLDGDRLSELVELAWATNQESYVPKLLNLTLSPPQRPYVNLWWRTLGLPSEWVVEEKLALPSEQVRKLESEGKVDEAIALAKKKGGNHLVERILLRASQWDEWLKIDTKRIPVEGPQTLTEQRVALLLTLGRVDEGKSAFEKKDPKKSSSRFKQGEVILQFAMGEAEQYHEYMETQPPFEAFSVYRYTGNPKKAFARIGLNDLSVESVERWMDERRYFTLKNSENPSRTSSDPTQNVLIELSDYLRQLGLHDQATIVERQILNELEDNEIEQGASVWADSLRRWTLGNDRKKAVHEMTEFLVREASRTRNSYPRDRTIDTDETSVLLHEVYRDAPVAMHALYLMLMKEPSAQSQTREKIEKVIATLEDVYAGRVPVGWEGASHWEDTVKKLMAFSQQHEDSSMDFKTELAEILDSVGQTKLAIQLLEGVDFGLGLARARGKYHLKLGNVEQAVQELQEEFRTNSTHLGIATEFAEALDLAGRYNEADRVRIQTLSSVDRERKDAMDRTLYTLPASKELVLVAEQMWLRDNESNAPSILMQKLTELAKRDLTLATRAAHYARINLLLHIKHNWTDEKRSLRQAQYLFAECLQPIMMEAIVDKNLELANLLFEMFHRSSPMDIDLPIDVVPMAEEVFGKTVADDWFNRFYLPMLEHLNDFPNDTLVGNNTAWLAASCNRNLDTAKALSEKVVAMEATSTYLDTLAEVEFRLGNIARAIELSQQCERIEPKDPHHRKQLKRFRDKLAQ